MQDINKHLYTCQDTRRLVTSDTALSEGRIWFGIRTRTFLQPVYFLTFNRVSPSECSKFILK